MSINSTLVNDVTVVCTVVAHSYQQCMKVSLALQSHWHVMLAFFLFFLPIWRFSISIFFLINISLNLMSLSNFSMYVLGMCIVSFLRCLFNLLPSFLMVVFFIDYLCSKYLFLSQDFCISFWYFWWTEVFNFNVVESVNIFL